MPKKSDNILPEVFTLDKFDKDRRYYLVQQGQIKRIGPSLYTSNLTDSLEIIVRRNLWLIVGGLYPGAVISERTAVTMPRDGDIFIISDKKRSTKIGNVVIRPKKGAAPQQSDLPFMDTLYLASPARIILENVVPSRARKTSPARGLNKKELEEYLDKLISTRGEAAINKIRDDMRQVAPQLGLQAEFEAVNKLISTLLQTHEGKLKSKVGIARSQGLPFDPRRVELFANFHAELEKTAPVIRPQKSAGENLYFFEAYFSNFIEGTEFAIKEAQEIIFNNLLPRNRPEDAHDIKGTYDIISDEREMSQTPKTFADFITLLKARHQVLLGGRADKNPGQFKQRANQAGATIFVAPDLVPGTLKQGFEIYKKLSSAFSKAVFMMFMVAEVHPFDDGNGRIARVMMNAELVANQQQRIIIPTVYRYNYISALKAISHNGFYQPIIKTLDFAQKYTGAVDWQNFEAALDILTKTRAFLDPNEAEENGLRLILPSKIES
jgi:hypothetical protein